MAKSIPDPILDLELDQIEGSHFSVCSGQPADYSGIAALELATGAIVGSVNKADGDAGGRKFTYPSQTDVPIDADGVANHVVGHNNTDTLKSVTTAPDQALTSGGTLTLGVYAVTTGDPT